MKKIPWKNYILFLLITVITIVITLITRREYLKREENRDIEKTMAILSEIKESDLSNYFVENQDSIIYLSSSKDDSLKDFEKEFVNYINNSNLNKQITYIDLSEVSSNFSSIFKEKYSPLNIEANLNVGANIIFMENGKVKNILYRTNQVINMSDVKSVLDQHIGA